MADRVASRRRAVVTTLGWATVAALLAAFAAIAYAVVASGGLTFDRPLLTWLHGHQTPGWTAVAKALTDIGRPLTLGSVTVVLLLLLAVRRRWSPALRFALQVGGAAALDLVLKAVFARPRPSLYPHLDPESNFSFPSGHALGGMAFFLALALLLRRSGTPGWRGLGAAGIALALLVGASRPYLQVHYPSDILAGWAMGSAWVVALELLLAPHPAIGRSSDGAPHPAEPGPAAGSGPAGGSHA